MRVAPEGLRFVPSHADGLPDVREVVCLPDHLDVRSGDVWRRVDFAAIARPPTPRLIALLRRLLRLPVAPPLVADRDFFHPPSARWLTFYTSTPLRICMPADEPADYESGHFFRVQEFIRVGGYDTYDVG